MRYISTMRGNLGSQRGLSLVEVASASLVLSLTFFAVVAMVRNARDIEHEGMIRSQAERIAYSALEEGSYHHSNYLSLLPGTRTYAVGETPVIYPYPETPSRFLTPVKIVVVHAEDLSPAWSNGIRVPFKLIEATVTWTLNGTHTVRATKRIARSQG